jgi:hypothetical protein
MIESNLVLQKDCYVSQEKSVEIRISLDVGYRSHSVAIGLESSEMTLSQCPRNALPQHASYHKRGNAMLQAFLNLEVVSPTSSSNIGSKSIQQRCEIRNVTAI